MSLWMDGLSIDGAFSCMAGHFHETVDERSMHTDSTMDRCQCAMMRSDRLP